MTNRLDETQARVDGAATGKTFRQDWRKTERQEWIELSQWLVSEVRRLEIRERVILNDYYDACDELHLATKERDKPTGYREGLEAAAKAVEGIPTIQQFGSSWDFYKVQSTVWNMCKHAIRALIPASKDSNG